MLAEFIMFAIATIMLALDGLGVGNAGVIFWVWIACIVWYCAAVGNRR